MALSPIALVSRSGDGLVSRRTGDVGTFSQEEAEAKIGNCVKTLIPLGGIPRGTRGTVTRALCMPDGYAVIVRWQLPRHRALWFDKEVYDYALVEAANQMDC